MKIRPGLAIRLSFVCASPHPSFPVVVGRNKISISQKMKKFAFKIFIPTHARRSESSCFDKLFNIFGFVSLASFCSVFGEKFSRQQRKLHASG